MNPPSAFAVVLAEAIDGSGKKGSVDRCGEHPAVMADGSTRRMSDRRMMGGNDEVNREKYLQYLDLLDQAFTLPPPRFDYPQQLQELDRLNAQADQLINNMAIRRAPQEASVEAQPSFTRAAAGSSAGYEGNAFQNRQPQRMGSTRPVNQELYQKFMDDLEKDSARHVDPLKELEGLQRGAERLVEAINVQQNPPQGRGVESDTSQNQWSQMGSSDGVNRDKYLQYLDLIGDAFATPSRDPRQELQELQSKIVKIEKAVAAERQLLNPLARYAHGLQPPRTSIPSPQQSSRAREGRDVGSSTLTPAVPSAASKASRSGPTR